MRRWYTITMFGGGFRNNVARTMMLRQRQQALKAQQAQQEQQGQGDASSSQKRKESAPPPPSYYTFTLYASDDGNALFWDQTRAEEEFKTGKFTKMFQYFEKEDGWLKMGNKLELDDGVVYGSSIKEHFSVPDKVANKRRRSDDIVQTVYRIHDGVVNRYFTKEETAIEEMNAPRVPQRDCGASLLRTWNLTKYKRRDDGTGMFSVEIEHENEEDRTNVEAQAEVEPLEKAEAEAS